MKIKLSKSFIVIIILVLAFAFLMFRPIQEKCFGEGKEDCNFLDELNVEHLFYLVILIFLLVIIIEIKKQQGISNNLLDVLVSK